MMWIIYFENQTFVSVWASCGIYSPLPIFSAPELFQCLRYTSQSQKTGDIYPMLGWYCATVYDAGTISTQHWVNIINVSCLLGWMAVVPKYYNLAYFVNKREATRRQSSACDKIITFVSVACLFSWLYMYKKASVPFPCGNYRCCPVYVMW